MNTVTIPPIYAEFVEYLAQRATPEEIIEFRVSQQAQQRAETLIYKNNAGTLTPDEEVELQHMFQFDQMVSAIKARALEELG